MNANQLLKKINDGEKLNVINVREKSRYESYHLPGALSINLQNILGSEKSKLNKNEKYYIVCNSGNSSLIVTHVLKAEGYDVESVEKGMNPLLNG